MRNIIYKLPEELNGEFNRSINEKNKAFIRIALLGGLFLYSVFALLDQALVPDFVGIFWFIRFAIILPVSLFVLLLTYSESAYKYIQPLLAFAVITGGLGIIAMTLLAPSPVNYNYYAGLILVFIYSYTFLRVRFVWATIAGWCIVIGYEIGAIYIINTPTEILINNNFFFISANILGMVSNLSYEANLKKEFHTAYKLKLSNKQIAENNVELEKRVNERMQELNELNCKLMNEIKEKEAAKKKSEYSNRITSEFLTQMSRQVSGPIRNIINHNSIIQNEIQPSLKEKLRESISGINSASGKVVRTIDNILNMSELSLGTYKSVIRETDITNLLQNLYLEHYKFAAAKGLVLDFNFDKDSSLINTDDQALNQIFSNLMDNAIKYTDNGKVDITLTHDNNDKITVRIQDTGKGIEEQYLPTLFDNFTVGSNGNEMIHEGSGLGLALVKRFCDLANIDISVSSEIGNGTTFILTL